MSVNDGSIELKNVIHTVGGLSPDAGGPSRTVPALCERLRRQKPNWDVTIVVGRTGAGSGTPDANGYSVPIAEAAFLKGLDKTLGTSNGSESVLLHDHGQWLPINHASASLARRRNLRRIVSPRGMLSPWSLQYRRWKKALAWHLYARRDLAQAAVVHATSGLEARELRDLGVKQPVCVIANGVDALSPLDPNMAAPTRPYILFLSRVHAKKGINELLRVWPTLNAREWELVVAGPDEQHLLRNSQLPTGVRYVGPVEGAEKSRLLQQASVFVLPSYSENFGVVVAEALMAGVPVIATHGTPWQSLENERCGWWIEMNEACLRDALRVALETPATELRAMGRRGREFAVRTFSWERIASQMAEVYEWVLGGGVPPACVEVRP